MSDPNRVDVARVELRDGYTIDGKSERWLIAKDFAMGYEEGTDKLVVQRRGSSSMHVIPWANVLGFEIERRAPVAAEVTNARPAPASGAGGGSRRARSPQ